MSDPWACATCTFINEAGGPKCEMCESPRPASSTTTTNKEPMQVDVTNKSTPSSNDTTSNTTPPTEGKDSMEVDDKSQASSVKLSEEKLKAIDGKRKEAAQKGKIERDPTATYKLVCPACDKPNSLAVNFCTGCSFALTEWDEAQVSENIFLEMINGKDIGATIHYRDDRVIVFDDKYGVSDHHLDIIPTRVIPDITQLKKEDVEVLNLLYERGLSELKRRNPARFKGKNIEDYVVAGYNHPGSVKHIHLHMALPPYKHEKVWQYPRWHPHAKVIKDLETFGEVRIYDEHPNKEEGEATYERAMKGHHEMINVVVDEDVEMSDSEKEQEKEVTPQGKEKGKEKETVPKGGEKERTYTVSAIEKAFDAWLEGRDGDEEQLMWLGEEASKITFGFGEEEFTLSFPRKGSAGKSFGVATSKFTPWVAEINDHLSKKPDIELSEVFDKLQEIIVAAKQKKRKLGLTQSTESGGSAGSDDEYDTNMLGGGLEEENDKNWIEERISSPHLKAVADEVRVAMELLGQGKISAKGNALVTVTALIDDVLTPALGSALELTLEEPVLVTFDFSRFWGLDATTSKLPLPQFSCRQWTTSDHNSFGVKYHLKEIVTRYIEDNWKWSDRATESLRLGTFTSGDKGENREFLEWKKKRGNKSHFPKTTTTTAPPPITPTPTQGQVDEKKSADLQALGFKKSEVIKTLIKHNNKFEQTLDDLFSQGPSAREPVEEPSTKAFIPNKEFVAQMASMGFEAYKAEAALTLTHNDMDEALEFLFANPEFEPPKQGGGGGKKGGGGLLSAVAGWFGKGDPDEELARQLQAEEEKSTKGRKSLTKSYDSKLSNNDTNFFVGVVAYIRARLANYTRYCMVCHKKHSCISQKPVICCNPLCIFRYSDLLPSNKKELIKESVDKVTICPFTDCEEAAKLSKDEAMNSAMYGAVTNNSEGTTQEALLEMHRHRYLPNDQVLEFIENGVKRNNMQIAKIENVLKAELVVEYEAAWSELKKKRGDTLARPQIAYHGTSETNINSIIERGLLVPGQGKGADVKHATDTGWWGKGIYLSPNSQLSVGYCRGGKSLLMCSVLMGHKFKCTNRMDGQPCQAGYDSHEDPSGQEWIIFTPAQVLPCYLITFA